MGIYKRTKKKVRKQENTHLFKKTHTRSRKKELAQENTLSRKKKKLSFFLIVFLVEIIFFLPLSFFLELSWSRACFLEHVLFFLDKCVFSCFLTFFFSFINSQPWRYQISIGVSPYVLTQRCCHSWNTYCRLIRLMQMDTTIWKIQAERCNL